MQAYVINRFKLIHFDKNNETFYCLFKAKNFKRVRTLPGAFVFDIAEILVGSDNLVFRKNENNIYEWDWNADNVYHKFQSGIFYSDSTESKKHEFPDDKSALLWFNMNY